MLEGGHGGEVDELDVPRHEAGYGASRDDLETRALQEKAMSVARASDGAGKLRTSSLRWLPREDMQMASGPGRARVAPNGHRDGESDGRTV